MYQINQNTKVYYYEHQNQQRFFKTFSNYHLQEQLHIWDFQEKLVFLKDFQTIISIRENLYLEQIELHQFQFESQQAQTFTCLIGMQIFEERIDQKFITFGLDDENIFIVLSRQVLIFSKDSLLSKFTIEPTRVYKFEKQIKTNKQYSGLLINGLELFLVEKNPIYSLNGNNMIISVQILDLLSNTKANKQIIVQLKEQYRQQPDVVLLPQIFHTQQLDSRIEIFVAFNFEDQMVLQKIVSDIEFSCSLIQEEIVIQNSYLDLSHLILSDQKILDFQKEMKSAFERK